LDRKYKEYVVGVSFSLWWEKTRAMVSAKVRLEQKIQKNNKRDFAWTSRKIFLLGEEPVGGGGERKEDAKRDQWRCHFRGERENKSAGSGNS